MNNHSNYINIQNNNISLGCQLFEEYCTQILSRYEVDTSTLYDESFLNAILSRENITNCQESNNTIKNVIILKNFGKKGKKIFIDFGKERIRLLKDELNIYFKEIKGNYLKKKRKDVYKSKSMLSKDEKKFIKNITYRYLCIIIVIIKKKLFLRNSLFIIF